MREPSHEVLVDLLFKIMNSTGSLNTAVEYCKKKKSGLRKTLQDFNPNVIPLNSLPLNSYYWITWTTYLLLGYWPFIHNCVLVVAIARIYFKHLLKEIWMWNLYQHGTLGQTIFPSYCVLQLPLVGNQTDIMVRQNETLCYHSNTQQRSVKYCKSTDANPQHSEYQHLCLRKYWGFHRQLLLGLGQGNFGSWSEPLHMNPVEKMSSLSLKTAGFSNASGGMYTAVPGHWVRGVMWGCNWQITLPLQSWQL